MLLFLNLDLAVFLQWIKGKVKASVSGLDSLEMFAKVRNPWLRVC